MSTVEQDVANLKTDMAELRAIVRELALSQQRTEIELQNFKEFVLTSQANWEQRWAKLEQERMMKQQEREKERQEHEKQREQDRLEWKNEKREMNKKWGELANKMGTLVGDIIAPNIQRLACELFDVGDLVDFSEFRSITHPTDKSRFKDFDALFIGSRGIILNETASTVRQSYIEEFIAFIPTVFEYLPEHRGKRVIPVFSSLYIPEQFVRYLTANKIYAMAMGDETMEILNYNDIPRP
jgi:hypothetical protein